MLLSRIAEQKGIWWSVEIPLIGVFTQGRSRRDATLMPKRMIVMMINRKNAYRQACRDTVARDSRRTTRRRWLQRTLGRRMAITTDVPALRATAG